MGTSRLLGRFTFMVLGLLLTACPKSSDPVLSPAELQVNPTILDFKSESSSQTFTISNGGQYDLTWTISNASALTWVKDFSATSGTVKTGSQSQITVNIDRDKLTKAGANENTIQITAEATQLTGGGKNVTIRAFRAVKPTVIMLSNFVSEKTSTSAKAKGIINDVGSSSITQHGHVWSTAANPTFGDGDDGGDLKGERTTTGEFQSTLTDLVPNTVYHVRAFATNAEGTSYSNDVKFTTLIPGANSPPTAISLTNTTIAENASTNTVIGTLSTTDADASDTHTYSLISGGSDFNIDGNELRASKAFDYETKNSYAIRIRTSDGKGGTFEKAFTITVSDGNDAPTAISLTKTSIAENNSLNTVIGTLSTTDADASDTHTYTLISGSSDFNINGNELRASKSFDYETKNSYSLRIRTSDGKGGTFEKDFTITVTDVNEAPTAPTLITPADATTNIALNTTLTWQASTDPDNDPLTYDVYLGKTNPPTKVSSGLTSLTYTPTAQTINTKYYWQIIAKDGKTTTSSVIKNYTTVAGSVPGDLAWDKTFGGSDWDVARSVIQTSDGGYAVAGETRSKDAGSADMWLVKLNSDGTTQWDKTFGGRSDDEAYSVIQTSDGGYALAGWTASKGAGRSDMWLVKINSDGTTEWDQTFGGSYTDLAYSVIQTSDGGYALAGETSGDMWLVKVNAEGTTQWDKTFGGRDYDRAESVIQTSDGGYALAGWTRSKGAGSYDMWLVKVNSSGILQWDKTFGGRFDEAARSVIQTSDGGYAVVGYTASKGAGIFSMWLVKVNSSGILQWDKTFGGTSLANSVIQTSDGGYALAGYTSSKGAGNDDMWLVKVNSDGTTQWDQTFGGSSSDHAESVIQTSDGGYVVAGYTESKGAGNRDMWLLKYKR